MVAEDSLIGTRVGNYVVTAPLGEGGMSTIYVAEHPDIGRRVAVKFLARRLGSKPIMVERFLAEAKTVARISHPNVVEIYDFGRSGDQLYYVMELLKGHELGKAFAPGTQVPALELLPYIQQVCQALGAAHECGVVHRDLKPSNVFVLGQQPLTLKLIDFGIAKMMEMESASTALTMAGEVFGTPLYMAPEQAAGMTENISHRTDFYSLGIMIYELLAGRPPFVSQTPAVLLAMHLRDEPQPLREVAPAVPDGIEALVARCLRKNPLERPESAFEILEEYARCVGSTAVSSQGRMETASLSSPNAVTVAPTTAKPQRPKKQARRQESREQANKSSTLRFGVAPAAAPTPAAPASPPPSKPVADGVNPHAATHAAPPQVRLAPAKKPPGAPTATSDFGFARVGPSAPPIVAKAPVQAPKAEARQPSTSETIAAVQPVTTPQPVATPQPKPEPTPAVPSPAEAPPSEQERPPTHTQLPPSNEPDKVLEAILARIQKEGDFPAIARQISEISTKALPSSKSSAKQLADSILKDYALTTRVLKLVNSALYERYTGKIRTISRAVVMMGFDQVRMAALGMSLFRNVKSRDKERASEMLDTGVASLATGLIAKTTAKKLGYRMPEEAFLGAMYRNLGKQLVVYYLPKENKEIQSIASERGISEEGAARIVLGISLKDLGVEVMKRWNFSERIVNAMEDLPEGDLERPTNETAWLRHISSYAEELCEVVTLPPQQQEARLAELTDRYRKSIKIDEEKATELVKSVSQEIRERYAAVLDTSASRSKFLKQAAKWVAQRDTAKDQKGDKQAARDAAPARARPAAEQPNVLHTAPSLARQDPVDQRIQAVSEALVQGEDTNLVLGKILETLRDCFDFHRVLLMIASPDRATLEPRAGYGPGIDDLRGELKIPIEKNSTDFFTSAILRHEGINVPDTNGQRYAGRIPEWYRGTLQAPAFSLFPIIVRARAVGLFYVDFDRRGKSLTRRQIGHIRTLRDQAVVALQKLGAQVAPGAAQQR